MTTSHRPRFRRRAAFAALAAIALVLRAASTRRCARGPENFADVAEKVIDAVVNISTSQNVEGRGSSPTPQLPPGSPFEEFFEDFFKNRRGRRAAVTIGERQRPPAARQLARLGLRHRFLAASW